MNFQIVNITLITLVLIGLASCDRHNSDEKVIKSYYESGALHKEMELSNGELDGQIKIYYENQQLKSVSSIKNGKRQGLTKTYLPDGTLSSELNFDQDIENGPYYLYHGNGNIFQYGEKLNGLKKGTHYEYATIDSGRLHYKIFYQIVRGQEYVNGYVQYDTLTNQIINQTPQVNVDLLQNKLRVRMIHPEFDSMRVVYGLSEGFYVEDSVDLKYLKTSSFQVELPLNEKKELYGYVENFKWVNNDPSTHQTISKEIYFEWKK
ncbi:MAG: hypothetical protein AAGF85_18385 [Bacteroidota bacterium]